MKHLFIILFFTALSTVSGQKEANPIVKIEDVKFQNGDIKLNGQLYIPNGKGPFPAVVFTHGSGKSGVSNPRYRLEAEYFAKHGIISLVFDKRGCGESSGNWKHATYEDLARDAVAAVDLLKDKQQVDTSRIGLRGISQSGWILPIAAKISKEIDFLILISPPGVTTSEQIVYDVRTDIEDMGFGPDVVDKATKVIKSGMEYSRTLDNWERHQAILDKYKGEEWLDAAAGPPIADHWLWPWVHPVIDFDAVPLVSDTKASILVILGEKDRVIPAQVAGYRFEKELQKRKGKYRIAYFPNAGHDLRSTLNKVESQEPPLVKGYLDVMKNWIIDPN